MKYKNGNAEIEIKEEGTRIIKYEGKLDLEQPLNIDVRVFNRCSNGYNPRTGKAICPYCHESQRTEGPEANYKLLKEKLKGLSPGIEIAIGINTITEGFIELLKWCKEEGYIVNGTINQLHLNPYKKKLKGLIEKDLIKGLGISYRGGEIEDWIKGYPNIVLHTIGGIDNIEEIKELDIKKVLILGYKEFGFGKDYFSYKVKKNIANWKRRLGILFDRIISFDNLALEQLDVKRYLSKEEWEIFYQGEESFYINAVEEYFSPSSRNLNKRNWDEIGIKEYYRKEIKGKKIIN